MSDPDPTLRPQGFTLIEVVVALLIFGLAFAVVARIIQTGVLQTGRAEAMTRATLLARSQLARIGIDVPVAEGELDGDAGDGFHWQIVIRPAVFEDNRGNQTGSSGQPSQQPKILPYQVEVTVAWGTGRPAETVTLTSLRLAAAEPAR
jgi:prepilin-type N-terminal cleavage/methylation domain-containing protein